MLDHLISTANPAGLDGSRFDVRIEEKQLLRVVRRALGGAGASLLITGSSGHTFMSRMVRGSLTSDALLGLECDVLICGTKRPRWLLH